MTADMTTDRRPILLWFRRDLRLGDHPALHEAARSGRPVIPVFLRDEGVEALGAAPMLRLGMGVAELARALEGLGSRLVLRRGRAADALAALVRETGAGAVWWTRLHDPASRERDGRVAAALGDVDARAFPGHLVAEPEDMRTGAGTPFRVQAPFLRALKARDPGESLPAPGRLPAPEAWPASDRLEDWRLDGPMNRGAAVVAPHQQPGEARGRDKLDRFLAERVARYGTARDVPSADGSSRLSENLSLGEISPRAAWVAALEARGEGAEAFQRELAWRDFCHHLLWHNPQLPTDHWRPAYRAMPWRGGDTPEALAWRQGRTGIPIVDAGIREMWVTGRMHNRARMVTASFLVKHLLTDWRVGLDFFADSLTDWDPASNAVNWQWVAGSGPDAAPFFRIFNPESQARTWDPEGAYERAWIAEGRADAPAQALSFFDAVPRSWGLKASDPYPRPVVGLGAARDRALAAFRAGPGAKRGA